MLGQMLDLHELDTDTLLPFHPARFPLQSFIQSCSPFHFSHVPGCLPNSGGAILA